MRHDELGWVVPGWMLQGLSWRISTSLCETGAPTQPVRPLVLVHVRQHLPQPRPPLKLRRGPRDKHWSALASPMHMLTAMCMPSLLAWVSSIGGWGQGECVLAAARTPSLPAW
jgi:hypothetical protein